MKYQQMPNKNNSKCLKIEDPNPDILNHGLPGLPYSQRKTEAAVKTLNHDPELIELMESEFQL